MKAWFGSGFLVLGAAAMTACGSSSTASPDASPVSMPDGAAGGIDAGLNAVGSFDPGFTPTSPNTPDTIEVTISGETLGENGLPFVPVTPGDPQFVDGWNVTFNKYIVVIGNVRLSPNATQHAVWRQLNPTVATKAGPWVVDVHKLATNGFNGFVGKDGEEPAGALFKFDEQDDGTAFDRGVLYAFSYDTVPAKYPATQVNLTADEFAIYDRMVQNGWDKYIDATATYVGTGTYPDPTIQAKFAALPTTVHFVFGWNDATSIVNCINPDNGDMAEDDLANRGIQPNSSGAVIAQITVHTDHLFWDKLKQEGTPLRMDYLAAWAPADTSTTPLDLATLATKPLAVTFADGTPLPDRAPYQNVPGGYLTDQANPSQITLDLNGALAGNIPGIASFMAFSAQSQMHLNANGLCYVVGQNASDPWYVPNIGH